MGNWYICKILHYFNKRQFSCSRYDNTSWYINYQILFMFFSSISERFSLFSYSEFKLFVSGELRIFLLYVIEENWVDYSLFPQIFISSWRLLTVPSHSSIWLKYITTARVVFSYKWFQLLCYAFFWISWRMQSTIN